MTASPEFTVTESAKLAAGLGSADEEQLKSVLVSPPSELPSATVLGLASLRDISFDLTEFVPMSTDTATVPASVTSKSGKVTRWLVYLQFDAGEWKIASTQAQS